MPPDTPVEFEEYILAKVAERRRENPRRPARRLIDSPEGEEPLSSKN